MQSFEQNLRGAAAEMGVAALLTSSLQAQKALKFNFQ